MSDKPKIKPHHKGSKILCQWTLDGKTLKTKTLTTATLKEGDEVKIEFGKIVKQFS